MSRIYVDACTIIYLVEGAQPFQTRARARISQLRTGGEAVMLTSRLSRLECRTAPLRDNNLSLLAEYDAFFSPADLQFVEIESAVVERATELRARYRLKTADAIHLASAIEARAELFLAGDADLRRCTEAKVEVLQP
jgi:uncharacterized protein